LGPHPSPEHVARLRREYELTRLAAGPGVVAVLALDALDGSPAIVEQDVGGESLARLLAAGIDLGEALGIGVAVARALDRIHLEGVIHKDVNPTNTVRSAQALAASIAP
jgi:histidine kinase